ncbi:MAG: hypothetical protein QF464_19235, partial [Myxococcota bacterium]|nr:hypothetical protein [Myxococcota bacterium]
MLNSLLITLTALHLATPPTAVLEPGLEAPLLRALRPAAGEAPGGWALRAVHIPLDRVEAVYGPEEAPEPSCDEAPLCVVLTRPGPADESVGHFVFTPSGTETPYPAGLLDGLRARLPDAVTRDPWKVLAPPEPPPASAPKVSPTEAGFRGLIASDADLTTRLIDIQWTEQTATYRFRTDDDRELLALLSHRPA